MVQSPALPSPSTRGLDLCSFLCEDAHNWSFNLNQELKLNPSAVLTASVRHVFRQVYTQTNRCITWASWKAWRQAAVLPERCSGPNSWWWQPPDSELYSSSETGSRARKDNLSDLTHDSRNNQAVQQFHVFIFIIKFWAQSPPIMKMSERVKLEQVQRSWRKGPAHWAHIFPAPLDEGTKLKVYLNQWNKGGKSFKEVPPTVRWPSKGPTLP